MAKHLAVLFSLFCVAVSAWAQTQEEKLARQYFDEGNYTLAAPYYAELAENEPESLHFYDQYLSCLLELKEFEKARKLVKKRAKKYESMPQYKVDEGYVLEKEGNGSEAEKVYDRVIGSLGDNYPDYTPLANAFKFRQKYDQAIRVYEKGEEVFAGYTDFGSQLALLYMETGNRSKGIEKYVNLVLNSGLPPDQSRAMFEMNITDSMDYVILRTILLRQIQKMPDNYALADLLKWTFIKQKDWNAAYVQTRALDKRLKEDGERMVELGELCMSNEAWAVASQCFAYVKDLGADKPFYDHAEAGLLETRYHQLRGGTADSAQVALLEKDFTGFISKRGYNDQTWRVVSRLSELYLKYLHDPTAAIDLLEAFCASPGIRNRTLAAAKIALGDAYVTDGDVWSSELLYAQVEKDYTEEALGQEAKFRRARLSYFRGDFDWAQIQLNVLKGATTQLISNNAIELALKISENLGIDSNYHALELFSRAELLIEQNRFNEAEVMLDSVISLYPGHSLSDDILFTRAGIREKQGRYSEAADLYETLVVAFHFDLLADNAWYRLAELYEYHLNQPDKAMECYKKIVIDFPGSLFQVDARKHYRRLRGDQI